MASIVNEYLNEVRSQLYLRADVEEQVLGELASHFQEKITQLKKQGFSEDEAATRAVVSFGKPDKVARLLYEACSKGSWTDAFKLSLPHFLIAAIFASSPLHRVEIVLLAFAVVLTVTIYRWWHYKPDWLYSWAGYALLPLFAGSFLLAPVIYRALADIIAGSLFPAAGVLAGVVLVYALTLLIIVRVSLQVIKRDWLIAALMLAPVPIIGCWMYHLQQAGGLIAPGQLLSLNEPVAQALLVLGIAAVLFIRLRQRVIKTGVIITVSLISMLGVGQALGGDIGFFGLLGLALFSLIFFVVPAAAGAIMGHGEPLLDNPPSEKLAGHSSIR